MKTSIKVSSPHYNHKSGIATIKLTTATDSADVIVNFKKLVPFANLVKSEVIDFFIIAASVYGIDRFTQRRKNSVDGWSREFEASFPVSDPIKWESVKVEMGEVLSFLTGDYWEVNFYESKFEYPNQPLPTKFTTDFKQVNLFSGGLDSLIGALDFLSINPTEKVLLASHYDSQMGGPKGDQKALLVKLNGSYRDRFEFIPSVKVSLSNSTLPSETTFRSRSILFLGIALMLAQAKSLPIVIPENGTVSLNYPLSPSRRSACSTRTTHPTVVEMLQDIWNKIGIDTGLSNPYEFSTKGEMVQNCKDKTLLEEIVSVSNSCGKRGHRRHWTNKNATHCGVCMPCVYRQASLLTVDDETTYGIEINTLYPFKDKKGQDIGACLDFLKTTLNLSDIKTELIINGIKNLSKLEMYADLVERSRAELAAWVKKVGNRNIKNKAGIL